ncbi:hypothetical protein FBU30_001235 [Linnemannia zychae]|nr:hypothetical protein FBU30_001235 [Linnemannia zychae]
MERLKGEGVQDWLSQHLTSPWQGHQTVASELGNEIISNIHDRWTHLGPSVQLGVLFSIISLKKAQQLQLKGTCQRLIDHACQDPDEWVKLVGRMLKDYPSEGTLRFNVEEFVDQAQMGSNLETLTQHINQDGIKFHPMEFAFLNESVCKEAQGKDPKTNTYPPITGPSIQQHFKLKDSHVALHTSRAEKLKKMAEQASPVITSTASGLSSGAGLPSGSAGSSAGSSTSGGGLGASSASTVSLGSSGLGGPPRPTKASSSGLFVRKQSGSSFLRSNAPRPMTLPRNPSATQLPLRSPRVDQPTTPRLIQKASRIQILDIQQGNEIMQSMNDDKVKLEQAEQREKELKREQRAQEIEAKRAHDAEKKAQALREKEEKKKEREDAKRLKERQKQEREEQLQREKQEKEQQNQTRETRPAPEDDNDDDEDAPAPTAPPARKKSRTSSSRRGSLDDDNYDGAHLGHGSEPKSPMTPSLASRYSSQSLQDDRGSIAMDYTPATEMNHNSDSYFPSHNQYQHQQIQQQQIPPPSSAASDHPTLFQDTNLLTADDRAYITAFMEGHPVIRPNGNDTSYQIVMNQEQVQDATGKIMYELILIEMNFETGEWRKIKRKRNRPHVPTSAFSA